MEAVSVFRNLGRLLTATDDDWPAVVGNIWKAQVSWGRLARVLGREATSPREGWAMVLPRPGGSNEGGRGRSDQDVDPSEAEYGSAIYCNATDSGPM